MAKLARGISILCLIAVAFFCEVAAVNPLIDRCANSNYGQSYPFGLIEKGNITICVYVQDKGYFPCVIRLYMPTVGTTYHTSNLIGFGHFRVNLTACNGTSSDYDCWRIDQYNDGPYPANDVYFSKSDATSNYAVAFPCINNVLQSGFVEFYTTPTAAEFTDLQTNYFPNLNITLVQTCMAQVSLLQPLCLS